MFGNLSILIYFKRLGLKKLMQYGFILENVIRVVVCALVFPRIVNIYGGATWILLSSIGILCMLMEFFNAFVNTSISTNLQNLVPPEMRARFFAILGMFSQGAVPLGVLFFGILLDTIRYYNILIAVNVISILLVAVFLIKACDEAYEAKI